MSSFGVLNVCYLENVLVVLEFVGYHAFAEFEVVGQYQPCRAVLRSESPTLRTLDCLYSIFTCHDGA